MNRLIVVLAAAVAAVLFRRRKTLKDDAAKVTSTAKEKAAELKVRVTGEDDETAVDLVAEEDTVEAEDTEASAPATTD